MSRERELEAELATMYQALDRLPKVEGDFTVQSDIYVRTKESTHILSSKPLIDLLRLRQARP
jgi:hypothetical protein